MEGGGGGGGGEGRGLFGQKENLSVYFSGKKGSLLHLNTAHRGFIKGRAPGKLTGL